MSLSAGAKGGDAGHSGPQEPPARTEAPAAAPEELRAAEGLGGLRLGAVEPGALEGWAEKRVQALDLESQSISAVPAVVYTSFPWLKVLDLRKNALEELLPDISVVVGLEELLLDGNRLRSIPAEVCALPRLSVLSLGRNKLGRLPAAIGGMGNLKALMLGDNCLAEIPPEVGDCRSLQTLQVHHNHFTALPTAIGQLESLVELTLEWFRYTSPPLPRVLKGPDWRGSIRKLLGACRAKREKGEAVITCMEVLARFSEKAFDPDAVDSKNRTRLHAACLEGHVGVGLALAASASIRDALDEDGYSPLLIAVREERTEIAECLVRAGADVSRGGGLYGTPLHVTAVNFDAGMVSLLLGGKADANQTDADGNAPLHVLMSVFDKCSGKACAVGETLLGRGADCNLPNCDGWSPLHLAARRGQLRGVCFAVAWAGGAAGRQPSVFDLGLRGGLHLWTPLHLSGHAGHLGVVRVLVEAGADVFLRNVDARTARQVSRGNMAISKLLRKAEDEWLWHRLQAGASPAEAVAAGGAADAAQEGLAEAVEALAARVEQVGAAAPREERGGSSASARPARGRRPCGAAAALAEEDLERLRAATFARPLPGVDGLASALTALAERGPKHRLALLLSRPWARDMLPRLFEDELGRLLHPSVVASEDVVRLLISSLPRERLALFGRVRNRDRETWIHVLCRGPAKAPAVESRADVLCLLLAMCPPGTFDLEAVDHRGQTALHLAAQSGDLGLLQVLLEAGADPNAQEETTGWTPLHFAVSRAHYSVIMQLLHHDAASVNQVDRFDWPPLFEACSRLDPRSVALLANGGAALDFRNQHDFDALRAVDTSKKDLPAKRWMSCLMVSNGFRFQGSSVQLSGEDRETLQREWAFFEARAAHAARPPFHVPDHLAPRCQVCKVLVSGMSAQRCHCRSCGIALCERCTTSRAATIVPLDDRALRRPLAAARRGPAKPTPPLQQPGWGAAPAAPAAPAPAGGRATGGGGGDPRASGDSSDEPEPAEELPPPPAAQPAAQPAAPGGGGPRGGPAAARGGLVRERGPAGGAGAGAARVTKFCAQCAAFHDAGVGETYAMLERSGF